MHDLNLNLSNMEKKQRENLKMTFLHYFQLYFIIICYLSWNDNYV